LAAMGQFLERVMVFIDAGYLQACIRDQFENRLVDITKFSTRLAGQARLIRTYYYTARIERPPDDYWRQQQAAQQRFSDALAYQPSIQVRWGRLQFGDSSRPRQKGVDVLLSLDMLRFALKDNYDRAILVSGDGDFADIVSIVKDEGRRVTLITFPGTRAKALLEAADVSIEVTSEFLEGCWRDGQIQDEKQEEEPRA